MAIYSIVTLGLGLLVGRVGMVSLGQGAVLALGAWVAARLLFATGLPYPLVLLFAGLITMVLGTLVGLPALRLSGLYLALITLMLAGAITVVLTTINFPNGGEWLHRIRRRNGSHPADPPSLGRDHGPGVLPLLDDRGDPDVRPCVLPHPRAPRTSVGGDPTERIGGARGRHQHHLLQALGVRARVVRHRCRRGSGRRQLPVPELTDVHHPGFDHAACGRADGRCLQHDRRGDRRVPAEVPAGRCSTTGACHRTG